MPIHLENRKLDTSHSDGLCSDKMTFDECEMAIIRHAVDTGKDVEGQKLTGNKDVSKMISILEKFLKDKKLLCYGGTAINNILPKEAQFYDKKKEIPDYDFYSNHAFEDAQELADIYYKAGFTEIEAKSGVHYGTYKVFVNFIPIADITALHDELFEALLKDSIEVDGIHYVPPDYLRMSMYLELSRPAGDTSRWEKVAKRLDLLNKHHPFELDFDCHSVDFQRKNGKDESRSEKLHVLIRDELIKEGAVFFGGYATSLYSEFMPEEKKRLVEKIPDFDVLIENIEKCGKSIVAKLKAAKFDKVVMEEKEEIGETVPKRIEITVDGELMVCIYEPIACHNYNLVKIDKKNIKIATIDTILSFYLSFTYAKMSYDRNRLLCMAKFLFDVEEENRLNQKGMLKRFNLECIGKQPTLATIRQAKSDKFKELSKDRDSIEFKKWFLNYKPSEKKKKSTKPTSSGAKLSNKTVKFFTGFQPTKFMPKKRMFTSKKSIFDAGIFGKKGPLAKIFG